MSGFLSLLLRRCTRASTKPARWISDPQAIKPGTRMPNFGEIMSDDIARRLAEWLKSGRPDPVADPPPAL